MTANISDAQHLDAPLAGGGAATAVTQPADLPEEAGNAVTRDRADHTRPQPMIMDYLRYAQTKSGRSPMQLVREFFRLKRGRGKLTFSEYVQYGVFDTARHSPEDQARFITNTLHWPITHVCCDMTWQATTEDKWLCSHILANAGFRVPETLAVIDKTDRHYPGTRKIATGAQLREFVTSQDFVPFFGKENRGICSYGAFRVEHPDGNAVPLKGKGQEPLPYDAFMDQFVGETPYLLQRLERNHSFFDRFTESLATVRVCILHDKDGIKIPFAILKVPARDNLADNFWRPGNIACNLDPRRGEILSIRSKDALGTTEHSAHPETGATMIGEVLPHWDRLLETVERCTPVFHPVRYQSMDIAIAEDGPVLIEVNTGGGFDLPQLASGQGFLTDEVCAFFRSCGYDRL